MKNVEKPPSLDTRNSLANLSGFTRVFAREIKAKRQELGMSQDQLAITLQSLGLNASQSYISRLEGGHREEPNTQLVVTLAALLDISIDQIIEQLVETTDAKKS